VFVVANIQILLLQIISGGGGGGGLNGRGLFYFLNVK
jgi:hypothetical protein